MPLQATSGAASYDAFGGGVAAVPNYIEDVFSTWLYAGNDSTQTITNGIDLAGDGGLVWSKQRTGTQVHVLVDTVRGNNKRLQSNSTAAEDTTSSLMSFNSDGYGIPNSYGILNSSGHNYASWTFRKQPKFFDVVTYTGTGSVLNVSHNLGSVPGCIIIKRTSLAADWTVYHRSTGNAQATSLNTTQAASASTAFNSTDPTSTVFTLGAGGAGSAVNANGQTYVAYLFAHNAGGFGLTGTDNVISCGSFTLDSINKISVTLGYEPQWLLFKKTNGVEDWWLFDNMRGFNYSQTNYLSPNTSNAETSFSDNPSPTSTGFVINSASIGSGTFIYIAIRRGPMKVPTSGTSVFAIDTRNATTPSFVSNFPVDMSTYRARSGSDWYIQSRLTPNYLFTNSTAAEAAGQVFSATQFAYNTGWGSSGASIPDLFSYMFQRAPSFFDEVCYTGTGSAQTLTHNLGATPELIIIKNRVQAFPWYTYSQTIGATKYLRLNTTDAEATSTNVWNNTAPTSTQFTVGSSGSFASGDGFVAYLFATCAGVSKVGSLTVTAGQQININCGFTGGARFVMVKRTDAAGDWMVFDTARGINVGDEPYLSLNSTAAETTGYDWISPYTTGFQFRENLYAASSTYIYLAIA